MTVVLIVVFSILAFSFITGVVITVYEEKKINSFDVFDFNALSQKNKLVQPNSADFTEVCLGCTIKMTKIQREEDEVELLGLKKTLIMKPIETLNLEKTLFFDKPILLEAYEDEELI